MVVNSEERRKKEVAKKVKKLFEDRWEAGRFGGRRNKEREK
jgi:hypothetical protein